MTPEKLEAWAKREEGTAAYYATLVRQAPDRGATPEIVAKLDEYAEDHREFAALLRRFAAKMREPDGWHIIWGTGPDDYQLELVVTEPDHAADFCRPILYLDSLEGE